MIGPTAPLALGSASPRRRALLEAIGIPLVVAAVDVDESWHKGETADRYLARIVGEKLARATADARVRPAAAILVADTIVLVDDDILGKPADAAQARSMLSRLSGRAHQVRTRFALGLPLGSSAIHAETVSTSVEFRALEAAEIDRYVATGEGVDKAGGYAIQGIGSFAVRRIDGSYANVVGLPVCEVVLALRHHALLGAFP
jgi:septum formation protein